MKSIVFPKRKINTFGELDVGTTFICNGKAYTKIHPVFREANLNAFCHSDSECRTLATNCSVQPCPDAELLLEGRASEMGES